MSRIKLLSPHLINQIAAGECIERPASVVKELVENSLDAGATSIQVEVEEAGNREIKVSDDGCGIEKDDLEMALTAHATSKISQSDDLWNIHTLGFRGEALASIASIADVSISSAVANASSGYCISSNNGKIQPICSIGMNKGTVIVVRDLFFNFPGRRKFLKNNATEFSHISNTIIQLALSHPHISFRLCHNQRQTFSCQASSDPNTRIYEILGIETIIVQYESQNYKLHAYISLPKDFRSNKQWQYCYVNQRCVRDYRIVLNAFQDAYKEFLSPKHYAMGVIYLQVNPTFLDVNVHPTKSEIRYRYEEEVYRLVHNQCLSLLKKQSLSVPITLESCDKKNSTITMDKSAALVQEESNYLRKYLPKEAAVISPYTSSSPTSASARKNMHSCSSPPEDISFSPKASPEDIHAEGRETSDISDIPLHISQNMSQPKTIPDTSEENASCEAIHTTSGKNTPCEATDTDIENTMQENISVQKHPDEKITAPNHMDTLFEYIPINPQMIFQLHNTYLVSSCEEGLLIIDQHALHERILYEKFRRQFLEKTWIVEKLLFPETIRLSPQEMLIFTTCQKEWVTFGLEANIRSSVEIDITSVPSLLGKISPKKLVLDLLAQMDRLGKIDISQIVHHTLASMACHSAIRAGDALSAQRILDLLQQRKSVENSSHCPHGRPTTIKITIAELEKYFHRK